MAGDRTPKATPKSKVEGERTGIWKNDLTDAQMAKIAAEMTGPNSLAKRMFKDEPVGKAVDKDDQKKEGLE